MTEENKKAIWLVLILEGLGAAAVGLGNLAGYASVKRSARKRAIASVEQIGGIEVFNNYAPKVARVKLDGGYIWIPSIVHIREEWWNRKLKVRRLLNEEDYNDIVLTCQFIRSLDRKSVV